MRFLLVFLTLLSFRSFAGTLADCELVDGVYVNSSVPLRDLSFETVVDIFTMNNANAVNMTLGEEKLRFLRTDMKVKKLTKLIYLQKSGSRAIHIMIDRTPKEISRDREFYGNLIISAANLDFRKIQSAENLVYNFYCSF